MKVLLKKVIDVVSLLIGTHLDELRLLSTVYRSKMLLLSLLTINVDFFKSELLNKVVILVWLLILLDLRVESIILFTDDSV